MTRRVVILTPDPAGPEAAMRWPAVLDRNAAPLRALGYAVDHRPWTDAGDLTAADLVLPLLAWGYPKQPERWRDMVSGWKAASVRLANGPEVLRWNADKVYLGMLAERGAPVVPARYVDRVTPDEMAVAAAAFCTDKLVAKPRFSSGAWQTIRWSPGDPIDAGPTGAAIIQPFLPDIEAGGELSLLYFGGRFSHAIRKRPQPGDFRVQPEFDGIITRHEAAPDELAAAEAVLTAAGKPLLYARIDLVRHEGALLLIEMEAIEPDLYLEHDPAAGALFGQAVTERLG
ncbi:ATP-grasp domain-containing protein [Allosphingosinicella indica]|uniref:Transporter n=1 Tax=Allosphingosinicella indica TaxID=941907 RepID=A0A1X7FZB8_9SPHN|nr:hypothetical protein [Allosphingosinicella indica]SMF61431.1 hypothetical protein SAMN06295910_0419 [Allosphingosinicella indica]